MSQIMEPGRELDALIAEKVMGWRMLPDNEHFKTSQGWGPEGQSLAHCPRYSTDIAAAWEVVSKIKKAHWNFVLTCHHGEWTVKLNHQTEGDDISEAESAPYAICLAALKAVETRDQSDE